MQDGTAGWALLRLGGALALVACGARAAPASETPRHERAVEAPAPASEVAPAAPEEVVATPGETCECSGTSARDVADAIFGQWLLTQIVDGWPPMRVLYSWTRAEQIEALRAEPTLLTRSRGEGGEISALDRAIASDPGELARRLREAGDGTRRFAWATPWPTRLGWAGGDYGDRLLRIEITDDALVAVYDETRDGEEEGLYTIDGLRIPLPPPRGPEGAFARDALRRGRLGLVLHTATGTAEDGTPRAFREIVIVDEAVVARWEYGTPRIATELSRAATVLAQQRAFVPEHAEQDAATFSAGLLERWRHPGAGPYAMSDLWARALALGSERYLYERASFDALIDALSVPQPPEPIDVVHVAGPAPRRRARTGGYQPLQRACRRWDLSMGCMDVP